MNPKRSIAPVSRSGLAVTKATPLTPSAKGKEPMTIMSRSDSFLEFHGLGGYRTPTEAVTPAVAERTTIVPTTQTVAETTTTMPSFMASGLDDGGFASFTSLNSSVGSVENVTSLAAEFGLKTKLQAPELETIPEDVVDDQIDAIDHE